MGKILIIGTNTLGNPHPVDEISQAVPEYTVCFGRNVYQSTSANPDKETLAVVLFVGRFEKRNQIGIALRDLSIAFPNAKFVLVSQPDQRPNNRFLIFLGIDPSADELITAIKTALSPA